MGINERKNNGSMNEKTMDQGNERNNGSMKQWIK